MLNRLGVCITHPESIVHYPVIQPVPLLHHSMHRRMTNLQPTLRPSAHPALEPCTLYGQSFHNFISRLRWGNPTPMVPTNYLGAVQGSSPPIRLTGYTPTDGAGKTINRHATAPIGSERVPMRCSCMPPSKEANDAQTLHEGVVNLLSVDRINMHEGA